MIGFHQKTARLKNGVVFCSLSSFDRENSYSEPVANYSRGPWYAAAALITDYFMACPTRRAARLLSADPTRGKNSTFLYHFLGAKHAPRLRPSFWLFRCAFFPHEKSDHLSRQARDGHTLQKESSSKQSNGLSWVRFRRESGGSRCLWWRRLLPLLRDPLRFQFGPQHKPFQLCAIFSRKIATKCFAKTASGQTCTEN
jgi:hypothetical protein